MTTYDEVMADIRAGRVKGNGARNIGTRRSGNASGDVSRSRQPRNSQSEHQLQRAVAAYLDRALPADAFWTSIDSAGRGAIQGARMKARGVKRGISDVLVLYQSATIWIELKSAKGRLTVEQKAFVLHACRAGHWPVVCRSIADLESELRSFGVPLRCKVSA